MTNGNLLRVFEATEEYLAKLAERGFSNGQELSLWQKVKGAFLEFLRKAGINLGFKLTDNDLRYILWKSYKNGQRSGNTPSGHTKGRNRAKGESINILDLANDIALQYNLGVGNYRRGGSKVSQSSVHAKSEANVETFFRDGTKTEQEKIKHYNTLSNTVTQLNEITAKNALLLSNREAVIGQLISEGVEQDVVDEINSIFEQAKRENTVYPGFYDSKTGKIYLCADQIKNVDHFIEVYFHEVMHSATANNFTGQQLVYLYNIVGESGIKELVPPYYFEKGYSRADLADEYISHLIEKLVEDVETRELLFKGKIDDAISFWKLTPDVAEVLTINLNWIYELDKTIGNSGNMEGENGVSGTNSRRDSRRGSVSQKTDCSGDERYDTNGAGSIQKDGNVHTVEESGSDEKRVNKIKPSVSGRDSSEETIVNRAEDKVAQRNKILQHVDELSSELNSSVRVINNLDEIPESEKRKRGAKGWYDVETGEVVVVLPNAESVEDARATVFHEVVGHKGLRKLLGNSFDRYLESVYSNASVDICKQILELAGGDFLNLHVATEEYLARLAERGFSNGQELSLWQKVKGAFLEFLRKAGINLGFELTDNDLRYILWKSYKNGQRGGNTPSGHTKGENRAKGENINILDLANDIALQHSLGVGNYRRSGNMSQRSSGSVRLRSGSSNNYAGRANGPQLTLEDVKALMEELVLIDVPMHTFKNIAEAHTWANEHIVGVYRNTETKQEIYISKKTIDKYFSQKAISKSVDFNAHLSVLKVMPQLIETAKLGEIHDDRDYDPNILGIQRLYGLVNYENKTYPVKLTVKVYRTGKNKSYIYEVIDIENQ